MYVKKREGGKCKRDWEGVRETERELACAHVRAGDGDSERRDRKRETEREREIETVSETERGSWCVRV